MMDQLVQKILRGRVHCKSLQLSKEVTKKSCVAELIVVKSVFSPLTLLGLRLRTVTTSQKSLLQTFMQLTLYPKEVLYW